VLLKFLNKIISYFFLLSISYLQGQELPPINIYSPQNYDVQNQNWAVSQSKDKFIYIANNKGLFEFNGAEWQLYPTPNETIMRSVKVIGDKVFTGFYMDFGYWFKDDYGMLKYTSIAKKNKIPLLEDEQFWNIIELDGWILFQSLQRIYLYNLESEEYKIINSPVKITKMFGVNGAIYFHQKGRGIYKIEKGVSKLVSDHKIFRENNVINIHSKENELLFLTDKKGFFLFDENQLVPWKTSDPKILNNTIYNSIQLENGGYVLGTISNGVLFLTKQGEIDYEIAQKNGLSNNTILSVFEDVDGNVWLGLDHGINSINTKSPVRIYRNNNSPLGTVYASIIHKGKLYLGTNQGLFVKEYGSEEEFTFIRNTQGQVWNLTVINNELFCAHDSGAFIIKDNKISKKIDEQGTWSIKKLDNKKLILGNYIGLSIVENKNNQWTFRNKIKGFNNSSKYFELYNDNQVFVNHEYKGVFKLVLDDDFQKVIKVVKDSSVTKGLHSSLIKYQGNILYAHKKGIYKYHDKTQSFVIDSMLNSLYTDSTYISGKLIFIKENNTLWGFSKKNISYISPGKLSAEPITYRIPISKNSREGATGYESINRLTNDKNLLGTYNGYIIIDTESQIEPKEPTISINTIKTNVLNQPQHNVLLNVEGNFSSEENNIEFDYSIPNFGKTLDVEYQYKLEGLHLEWSSWSTESKFLFKNLSFGSYTFHVRAKIGNTISDNIAKYSFSIGRPWYLSNLVIAIYVLMFVLLVLLIQSLNKRYYKNQSKRLLEKQQREFALQELEKEKQVMFLKNEQLRADVDNKNRELATSTMSMIKKNEFLSTIKNELKKVDDKNVNNVIKIIDKDLNNTDDWKMFEEAFNNADKDFIKKVKSLHSDLTPNDLRLCAYLRLNLSSKEIAPLLNISPRSVEVKRYRLRKKMNLEHNANLTNYILEI